jgi:hypothetical protein
MSRICLPDLRSGQKGLDETVSATPRMYATRRNISGEQNRYFTEIFRFDIGCEMRSNAVRFHSSFSDQLRERSRPRFASILKAVAPRKP